MDRKDSTKEHPVQIALYYQHLIDKHGEAIAELIIDWFLDNDKIN